MWPQGFFPKDFCPGSSQNVTHPTNKKAFPILHKTSLFNTNKP